MGRERVPYAWPESLRPCRGKNLGLAVCAAVPGCVCATLGYFDQVPALLRKDLAHNPTSTRRTGSRRIAHRRRLGRQTPKPGRDSLNS